jgi:ubiquinone/menaquinone biosynthesis C-methylase UbiE
MRRSGQTAHFAENLELAGAGLNPSTMNSHPDVRSGRPRGMIRGRSGVLAPLLAATLAATSLLACSAEGTAPSPATGTAGAEAPGPYRYGKASRDGTGKFFMGREISHVMGHLGAGWLERPQREREERTDLLVDNLPLAPDSRVADIGAGTGYFSFRIAERVPEGEVLAVDIQPEMLALVEARTAGGDASNVRTVLGTETDPNLPTAAVDLILLVDAWHEFSHPLEMGRAMARALRPGGRLVLVEYRGEDPSVPIKPLHKMTEAQARSEMESLGLRWERTEGFLPQQHFMVFVKPAREPAPGGAGGDS